MIEVPHSVLATSPVSLNTFLTILLTLSGLVSGRASSILQYTPHWPVTDTGPYLNFQNLFLGVSLIRRASNRVIRLNKLPILLLDYVSRRAEITN